MDDIQGAAAVGIKGCLVKTGKYLSCDENKLDATSGVFSDFPAVIEAITKHLEKK